MKLDNAQLTAFVVGELSTQDRLEIEREARLDQEIAAEIKETEEIATLLRNALKEEPAGQLKPAQRELVLAARHTRQLPEPAISNRIIVPAPWWNRPGPWQAVAASAIVSCVIYAVSLGRPGAESVRTANAGEYLVPIPNDAGVAQATVSPDLASPGSEAIDAQTPAPSFDSSKTLARATERGPRVIPRFKPNGNGVDLSGASIARADQKQVSESWVTAYLEMRVKEAEQLSEGAAYADFAKVFQPAGDKPGRYEMRRAPLIKVDAEFVGADGGAPAAPTVPDAKLKKISKPYLESR